MAGGRVRKLGMDKKGPAQKPLYHGQIRLLKLVRLAGFEPAACGLGISRFRFHIVHKVSWCARKANYTGLAAKKNSPYCSSEFILSMVFFAESDYKVTTFCHEQ